MTRAGSERPPDQAAKPSDGLADFAVRAAVVAGLVGLALALWRLRDALSVGFGSIVLAVSAVGFAKSIQRRTHLSRPWALAIVLGLSAGVMAAALAVFGATIAAQFDELSRKLPESLRLIAARVNAYPLASDLLDHLKSDVLVSGAGVAPRIASYLIAAVGTVLTYSLIMIFGAVFLALEPDRYLNGLVRLIPPAQRTKYASVLDRIGTALQRWMISRLVVMVAVGVMSSLGLWALGIDAPFALGLTGAILTFIPHIGSVMSVIPAAMIAFIRDPVMTLWVIALFWFVHFIEGTFITPYAQDEAVDIPPVVSIFSTLVFTVLLGPIGVVLAGPLMVVVFVAVEALYVEDVLGERAPAPREKLLRRLMKTTLRQGTP